MNSLWKAFQVDKSYYLFWLATAVGVLGSAAVYLGRKIDRNTREVAGLREDLRRWHDAERKGA